MTLVKPGWHSNYSPGVQLAKIHKSSCTPSSIVVLDPNQPVIRKRDLNLTSLGKERLGSNFPFLCSKRKYIKAAAHEILVCTPYVLMHAYANSVRDFSTGDVSIPPSRILYISKFPCIHFHILPCCLGQPHGRIWKWERRRGGEGGPFM